MEIDELTRIAIEQGKDQAARILEFRNEALAKRAGALQKLHLTTEHLDELRESDVLPDKDHVRRVAGSDSAGYLIAEGDSWFDYPWTDIIRLLEDEHLFDVESVAHKGDTIESMAYGGGQLEELARRLEKLLRRGVVPRAVLLSGGGNDVAGSEFAMLLNHARSPSAGFNEHVLAGVIDQRVRWAYARIISVITDVCQEKLQRNIPILVHGYDFPVPDGRGFWGGWWVLPGPWLEPGFRVKGYEDMAARIDLAHQLIERFNTMLESLVSSPEFSHVDYVNLRGTLSTDPTTYKESWDNELHPTEKGFRAVTDRIAAAIP